ncbi:hypothetical protein BY458DRAFT_555690 [Sporodiniella umbellata]|nr:hypothetical protein BY458DRAFT_555690 [Sporodiniella umbellata]
MKPTNQKLSAYNKRPVIPSHSLGKEQSTQFSSATMVNSSDEEHSLGSSQTIQIPKVSILNKIKSFYSEKSNASNTVLAIDQEQRTRFSSRRVMAVFMIGFGTLMAIAFILVALGKSAKSGNTAEINIVGNSTTPSAI